MRLWSNIARHVRRNRAACCIVPSLIRQTSISSLSEFTAPACLAPRLHSLPSPCSDAPSFSFNLLMASPLLGSTYCSPACLRSRTQPQPSVSVSISGSILPKPVAAALFNKRPTPFSAVHNRSLAHPSISFSMSRRTRSPVIAQVSQTESKPNSKSEGQPPEDNFYIAVTLCLTNVLKQLRQHQACMQCVTRQQHCQELHKLPLHGSLHSSVPAILQLRHYDQKVTSCAG